MTIKIIDSEVQRSARGFASKRFKYLDTKTKKTWWGEWGDLSENLKINGKNKKA